MRREPVAVTLAAALGGVLVVVAAGRAWGHVPLPGARHRLPARPFTGHEVVPSLPTLGVVLVLGVVAVLATRRWGRAVVGVTLAATGGDAAWLVGRWVREATRTTGWPYVALAGALLAAVAGLAVAVRGPRWPGLSARYDAPGPLAEPDLWDALDRGHDPTI